MIITQINDSRVMTDFPKSGHIYSYVEKLLHFYMAISYIHNLYGAGDMSSCTVRDCHDQSSLFILMLDQEYHIGLDPERVKFKVPSYIPWID